MTFLELQARATLLASMGGWTESSPAPTWTTLVNQAWHLFSWDAECLSGNVASFNTVSGNPEYYLGTVPVKRILDATYDSSYLTGSDDDYERWLNKDWRLTAGTPTRWAQTGLNTITLIPCPNAVKAVIVYGVLEGSDMTQNADQPGMVGGLGNPIPASLHEAVALKAAILQGKGFMQGEESARIAEFERQYQEYVARSLAMNGRSERES